MTGCCGPKKPLPKKVVQKDRVYCKNCKYFEEDFRDQYHEKCNSKKNEFSVHSYREVKIERHLPNQINKENHCSYYEQKFSGVLPSKP